MDFDQAVQLLRDVFFMVTLVSLPVLMAALLVGLAISLFQAMTQLQEQTLTFVPKIIAMVLTTVVALPWMGQQLIQFAQQMFSGQWG